jgi:hypothetical protein
MDRTTPHRPTSPPLPRPGAATSSTRDTPLRYRAHLRPASSNPRSAGLPRYRPHPHRPRSSRLYQPAYPPTPDSLRRPPLPLHRHPRQPSRRRPQPPHRPVSSHRPRRPALRRRPPRSHPPGSSPRRLRLRPLHRRRRFPAGPRPRSSRPARASPLRLPTPPASSRRSAPRPPRHAPKSPRPHRRRSALRRLLPGSCRVLPKHRPARMPGRSARHRHRLLATIGRRTRTTVDEAPRSRGRFPRRQAGDIPRA